MPIVFYFLDLLFVAGDYLMAENYPVFSLASYISYLFQMLTTLYTVAASVWAYQSYRYCDDPLAVNDAYCLSYDTATYGSRIDDSREFFLGLSLGAGLIGYGAYWSIIIPMTTVFVKNIEYMDKKSMDNEAEKEAEAMAEESALQRAIY